jgi:two-component system, LuxR family, sensor kinase FixL
MIVTLRINEASDPNTEKMAKNACQTIVELAQQIEKVGSAKARRPARDVNTSDITSQAPPAGLLSSVAYHHDGSIAASLFEARQHLKSISASIRGIGNIRPQKNIEASDTNIVEFSQGAELTQNKKLAKHAGFADSADQVLDSYLKTAPDALVTTTNDGYIESFNERAEQLFAYSLADVRGAHIAVLLEASLKTDPAKRQLEGSQQFHWQPVKGDEPIRGRKKSGELFPIEVLESQYGQNGSRRLYHIKDLSLTSRQQQRIAELECEIAYLSQHSVLGELATTITHELSQPLTAITNYTAAAVRCLTQPLPEQRESGLDLMVKAGDQAKRAWLIMHRLRKLLQHRGIECISDDLVVAVEEAVQLATLGADRHGIQVTTDLPPDPVMVSMDRVHVQVLVTNLIRNAIDELSVSDGEKMMWVRLRVLEGHLAELSVEDTGAGIAPDIYENMFDPFHTTKPHGLGVGLAVSRRIALAHGGRLSAENRSEGGAVFRFVVPLCMSEKVKNE